MNSSPPSLWQRACRVSLVHSRHTRKRLRTFIEPFATDRPTLVVHCTDLDHKTLFPNATFVGGSHEAFAPLDGSADRTLEALPADHFPLVVCTGLLEHVPDLRRLISQLHRVLSPGGTLILSASAVFPFHGGDANYFHFTPNGLRLLLGSDFEIERLEGSTQPFETVAVLLQRINIQCDVFPPLRPLIDLATLALPVLDRLVFRQYVKNNRRDETTRVSSIMPATLHLSARKVP